MLAPDLTQARPSQMCHPAIEDAKNLVGPTDRSGIGVVLINAAGEITVCNQRAEAIVRQADGLSVMKSRRCATSSTEALIADAVADRANQYVAPGGVAIVHRPSLRQPFVLVVSRLTGATKLADDPSHPRAVVLIKDPSEADGANPGLLIDLFGHTRPRNSSGLR